MLRNRTIKIALIAIFAAMLTGGKFALSFIPNVEVVSLIIVAITLSLGLSISIPVILIFVTTEGLLYGFGYWLPAYYIYWPLLSIVFYIFNYHKTRPEIDNAILVAIMTFIFGLITTFIETVFAGGLTNGYFIKIYITIYARGIMYFAIHIMSNFIIVFTQYKPLNMAIIKARHALLKDEFKKEVIERK